MIDWELLCNLLRAKYKPLSTVAKEVGSNWQHLNRIARGETDQPKFDTGIRLLDLAFDVLPADEFSRVRSAAQLPLELSAPRQRSRRDCSPSQ